jgi:hypothetical protein
VAGEPVQSVETVTEEHLTEKIRETPLPSAVVTNGADSAVSNAEEPAPVAEDAATVQSAEAVEAAPLNEAPADAAAADTLPAETLVTSPSSDEVAGKDKGSKSKGLIGFLKARTRSQSRERDERAKEEQKAKKEVPSDDQKKSGTLDREKKFKLNLFGKKGEDEKVEATEDAKQTSENEKEAAKPKSIKSLFGKKNKDKSVDDSAVEKHADDKEKTAAAEEHSDEVEAKSKERKWFHFGRKPAKEVSPAIAGEAAPAEKEPEVAETSEQPASKQEQEAETGQTEPEEKPVALAESEATATDEEKPASEVVETSAEPSEDKTDVKESSDAEKVDEKKEEDQPQVPEAVDAVKGEEAVEVIESVAAETVEKVPEAVEVVKTDDGDAQASLQVDSDKPEDESAVKDVSPGGTLQKESEAEVKDQSKEQSAKGHKKFSFGFKFGKKQKSQSADDAAEEHHQAGAEQAKEGDAAAAAQETEPAAKHEETPEQPAEATHAAEDAKHKQSKIKLFHFGKKSKSKQKEDDEKEPKAQDAEPAEAKDDAALQPAEANADVALSGEEKKEDESEKTDDIAESVPQSEEVIDVVVESVAVEQAEPSVQPEALESKQEAVASDVTEAVQKAESGVAEAEVAETGVASETKAPETTEVEVKAEHKEQKKSLFGIKFGGKHETKEDETHGEDGQKKEAKWSPFGKKLGKKGAGETVKVDADGSKAEAAETKVEAAEETKAEEAVGSDEGAKTAVAEEAPENAESKAPEAKEKTHHVRMPKLFSFGKKDKASDEKPADAEALAKAEEAPAESVQPEAADESSKPKDEPQPTEEKKHEEADGEKKEESKLTTGIRKLFTIGKKSKEQHEEKKDEDAGAEETAAEQKPQETSPEAKQKQLGKAQREKSPHRKFPFDIKFGKKKDKEEVESPGKEEVKLPESVEETPVAVAAIEESQGDQNIAAEKEQIVVIEAPSAVVEISEEAPAKPVVELDEETLTIEVTVPETQQEPEPEPTPTVSEEARADVVDTPPVDETVTEEIKAPDAVSDEAQQATDEPIVVELETSQQVAAVSCEVPVPSGDVQEPASAAAAEPESASEKVDVEEQQTQGQQEQEQEQQKQEQPQQDVPEAAPEEAGKAEETAAVESPATGKEHKGRRRFPFGFKFGKRAERAKSAERAIPPKTTQAAAGEEGEKVELAKTVESSASVPDVRLHVEAEGGDASVAAGASNDGEKPDIQTDTPSKVTAKHELPHLNIKWPHFGKKKQEYIVNGDTTAAAAGSDENKASAAGDEAQPEKDATPKKQQQISTAGPLTDSQKKSSLGKGIFKLFSPRRHGDLHKSASCSAGDDKEPFVSYSVEGEGQIVAETQWRNKTSTAPETASDSKAAARLSKSPTTFDQRDREPLVDVVADVVESRPGTGPAPASGGHFVVVAIDFGTTYSGYAFSFARDARTAAGQAGGIHMMRRWEGGDPGVVNQKTPTTILLTPNGEFHSFGFTARDFYHDLDPTEAGKWLYFEKFKMDLHQTAVGFL